ncbi:C6 zinc finger domain-containing protein [Zalerion maritima]|uniref:C6 zinc finger domain-containing protein n=1 Tax=Zalerion maritima TaxID=339359 RepID=A0AAD5RJH2_9PEZI|nr:C6 zinc finger domain-containing protein [Zalerion maritima]
MENPPMGDAPRPGPSQGFGEFQMQSIETTSPATSTGKVDEFSYDPGYIESREELRQLIFITTQSRPQSQAPTRQPTPSPPDLESDGTADAIVPDRPHTETDAGVASDRLTEAKRVEYLKNYLGHVAPWLDMFDANRVFGIQVPLVATRWSPALLSAILALSARQIERKADPSPQRRRSFHSLELYQEAIRLLAPMLQARDAESIPICVILCCLEMMSASAQDWRRHLEGCAALFDAFTVHGFSGGLHQAVFWCYARMDLCGAIISDGTEGTLLPTSKWIPPLESTRETHSPAIYQDHGRAHFRSQASIPDMYANYAVYLCASVCELLADRTRYVELGVVNGCDSQAFKSRWLALWDDLQVWIKNRPSDLLPASMTEVDPFPQILFLHWAAISSTQLYHTACILLLGSTTNEIKSEILRPPGSASHNSFNTIWHAKLVCGISLTNPHEGCLNNAIQPLWVAGRLLSHSSEHALVVQLIRQIEATTGWGTCWRIRHLEAAWGYKSRPFTQQIDQMSQQSPQAPDSTHSEAQGQTFQ